MGLFKKMKKVKQYKGFYKNFHKGKDKSMKHPIWTKKQRTTKVKVAQLTHSDKTRGVKNIKLYKNPNRHDPKVSYVRPKPLIVDLDKYTKIGTKWRLTRKDKKLLLKIINQ